MVIADVQRGVVSQAGGPAFRRHWSSLAWDTVIVAHTRHSPPSTLAVAQQLLQHLAAWLEAGLQSGLTATVICDRRYPSSTPCCSLIHCAAPFHCLTTDSLRVRHSRFSPPLLSLLSSSLCVRRCHILLPPSAPADDVLARSVRSSSACVISSVFGPSDTVHSPYTVGSCGET
jgi:hypothetical protein